MQKVPRVRICTKFGIHTSARGRRHNHLRPTVGDRFRGVDSVGGQILTFPVDNSSHRTGLALDTYVQTFSGI